MEPLPDKRFTLLQASRVRPGGRAGILAPPIRRVRPGGRAGILLDHDIVVVRRGVFNRRWRTVAPGEGPVRVGEGGHWADAARLGGEHVLCGEQKLSGLRDGSVRKIRTGSSAHIRGFSGKFEICSQLVGGSIGSGEPSAGRRICFGSNKWGIRVSAERAESQGGRVTICRLLGSCPIMLISGSCPRNLSTGEEMLVRKSGFAIICSSSL